jgi:hypothetical protein
VDLSREFPPGAKIELKILAGPEDGLTIVGEDPVPPPMKPRPTKSPPPPPAKEVELLRDGKHARWLALKKLPLALCIFTLE